MSNLYTLNVEQIANQIKEGKISSREVCEIFIERINKFEKI